MKRVLSTVSTSYSTGSVIGKNNVGGLVGKDEDRIVKTSYWDKQTSGINTSSGSADIYGLTTEQMKVQSSYLGWNFDIVWKINPGEYPTLR